MAGVGGSRLEEFLAVPRVGLWSGWRTWTDLRHPPRNGGGVENPAVFCLRDGILSVWEGGAVVEQSCQEAVPSAPPHSSLPLPPWPCRSSQLEFRRLQTWFILNQVLREWVDPPEVRWCVAGGVALIPGMVTRVYLLVLNVVRKKKSEPLLCGLSPQSDFCHLVLIIPIHISSDSSCALVHKGFSYFSDFNYAQISFLFMLKFSFLSGCSCCTWKDCAAHRVYGTRYGPYSCHFLYLFLRWNRGKHYLWLSENKNNISLPFPLY